MKQYEYEIYFISNDFSPKRMKTNFNELGKEGWAIKGIMPTKGGSVVIFQRELPKRSFAY